MTEKHECRCRGCDPARFTRLEGTRQGEGHVAVRFGDADRGRRWLIVLNGENVADSCHEAMAGIDGWVAVYSEPKHLCARCGIGACQDVRDGDVHVGYKEVWSCAS